MPFQPPRPADEPTDDSVRRLFARAGADWTLERTARAELPKLCPSADRWLPLEFPAIVLDLATRLGLDGPRRAGLVDALRGSELQTVQTRLTATTLTRDGRGRQTVVPRKLGRREACEYATQYLTPLLDAPAHGRWLEELARTNFFLSRGGGSPRVPLPVAQEERARDARLVERWMGDPPVGADRARAAALIGTDPEPEVERAKGRRPASLGLAPPAVVLKGRPVPANLYVSEIARVAAAYVRLVEAALDPVARPLGLTAPLTAVAYGVVATALVPVGCLYDEFHGTCTVETLLPRLAGTVESMREVVRGRVADELTERTLRRSLEAEERDVRAVLAPFAAFVADVAAGTARAHARLVGTIADQSGGRIRTPERVNQGGLWSFALTEPAADGTEQVVERLAAEAIAYQGDRAADVEIFWILRSTHDPIATAIALVNQSGFRFWINAANNRWGGHHPPHETHRQGTSLDFDIGFVWRSGHRVPNVKSRDSLGPLPERDLPGNEANPDCLLGVDRIAGWVGVQAMILVGVTQYIYGDAGLVEEAGRHLGAHMQVTKPARMNGTLDALHHNDHWHFEILAGPRPAGADPYVWQVRDPGLLDRLRALAVERDADPRFWKKLAGLDAVPDAPEDFDAVPVGDPEDWKRWWERRNGSAGIPLLPVWHTDEASETYDHDSCGGRSPAGDYAPPGSTAA
jgi:hypothetical protein